VQCDTPQFSVIPYTSMMFSPRRAYQRSNSGGIGAAPPAGASHWSSPSPTRIFLRTMARRIGTASMRSSFSAGIFACTPCWNFTHSRGTEKNTVGRARCRSAANVSRLSAKKTCMPLAICPCSTAVRSATWDSGR